MFYALLGRAVWRIFRGYVRHAFPNARRNFVAGGIAALLLAGAGGAVLSRRQRDDQLRRIR